MIKTVIFDMDGVIVDTEPVHHFAYHAHFRQLGIEVSDSLFATFTGNSTKNVYQKLKERFGLEQEVHELVLGKRNLFNETFDTHPNLELIPGVENLIKELYADGVQLILASSASKSTIQRVFQRFRLHPYFSHQLSGEDFEFSKPDPAIFLKAWELSGHDKSECVIIEDSTSGVLAAQRAGIFCIGYLSANTKGQNLEQANCKIADFADLNPQLIRTLH